MTGPSAALTASVLAFLSLVFPNVLLQRCCLEQSPGFGSDFIWTPGLFAEASFALIKLDPLPDGGWCLQLPPPEANGTRRRCDVGARLGCSLPSLPLISGVVLGSV